MTRRHIEIRAVPLVEFLPLEIAEDELDARNCSRTQDKYAYNIHQAPLALLFYLIISQTTCRLSHGQIVQKIFLPRRTTL